MSKVDYTVAVIGGGPAGSVAALALAQSGVSVLLASAKPTEAFQVGESLVPSARTILEKLGVWNAFLAGGHLPCYGNISAWGSSELVDTDFIRSPYGHGWHLDRVHFDTMLCQAAEESGAAVWNCAKLVSFERRQSNWRLSLKTSDRIKEVTCEWLVDCTGRSYCIAKALGVERHYEDRLLAFYARFGAIDSTHEDQDSRTMVESVPQGWFHTALLPSRERIVTFFTDAGTAWVKKAKSCEGLFDLIEDTAHISHKLKTHRYVTCEKPNSRDARSSRLKQFQGEGWLAAGDAATSYDPLSSQGILFGLYSGLKAGNAVANYLDGKSEALVDYDSVILSVYNSFLSNRLKYYGYEQRWRKSAFWKARIAA